MSDARIDCIVLNWNGGEVLSPCLESLRRVERPALRVTVVDNASTDGSDRLVRERFPEVELVRNERNLLFAEGNNVGIRRLLESGSRRILLLNNDTEVDPLFAGRLLDALDADPAAGIAGPKILYWDDPGRIWYGGGGFAPLVWTPRHEGIRRPDDGDGEPRRTAWVSGCAMLVRREVFEAIGLLDPSYTIYCEDVDFCLRARRAGFGCLYAPAARVFHKVSSSSGGGMTPFKLEHRLRSTRRLHRRFRGRAWRLALLPAHGLVFLGLLAGLLLTGRRRLAAAALRGLAGAERRKR